MTTQTTAQIEGRIEALNATAARTPEALRAKGAEIAALRAQLAAAENFAAEMINLTDTQEQDHVDTLAMVTRRAATMEEQRRAAVKAQTKNHPWRRIA